MLRGIAVGLAVVVLGIWVSKGGHPGWTQTSVPVETLDEVTGLTQRTYVDRWVPGLDFLGVGLVIAVLAGAGSFLIRSKAKEGGRQAVN